MNKLHFLKIFTIIYLSSQFITRLVLSIYTILDDNINLEDMSYIFSIGLINDVISMLYVIPFILLGRFIICGIHFKSVCKRQNYISIIAHKIFYFVVVFILISNCFGEIGFWDEFYTRYNFIAVDYLIYTQEVVGTLYESFPIIKVTIGVLLFSAFVTYMITKNQKELASCDNNLRMLCLTLFSFGITFLLFKFYDSEKIRPLNNAHAIELSKNGPYEFFSAFRNNSLNYTQFYKAIKDDKALESLKANILQPNQQWLEDKNGISRLTKPFPNTKQYNVIILTIESMSAEYMKRFGNQDNITPNLDALASESIVFDNLYAAGTRTVRGLEAITLGVPPTPGSAIIRRNNNEHLFNIGSVLKDAGYEINFLYGGFSYFDNLEYYFQNNDYNVIDRNNLSSDEITFANIWGVADEDILRKSLQVADAAYANKQRFFSLIMTTSNHRPYTFPEGRIDRPSGSGGRLAAVKYTDYAIGEFIKEAKTKPWFNDTIFVITADHCASSAGKTKLPIDKYHIPMMIYAPSILKPREITYLVSQIDIPSTVLGLLDIEYKSKFIGQDAIHFPTNRAFISTYQLLGYLKGEHLVVLAPKKKIELYKVEHDNQIIGSQKGQEDLINEAISFYQTSYDLFRSGNMKND